MGVTSGNAGTGILTDQAQQHDRIELAHDDQWHPWMAPMKAQLMPPMVKERRGNDCGLGRIHFQYSD